jgi:hypothetical protein
MSRIGPHQLADTIKLAISQGWRIEITQKNHIRFTPPDPDRPQVICAGTPGCWRSLSNDLARLKKSGLKFPAKQKKKKNV